MQFSKKSIGLILFTTIFFSIFAGVLSVRADQWKDHADIAWYDPNYSTFTIDTAEKLAGVAKLVNNGTTSFNGKVLELSANLDLSGHDWVPIGDNAKPFKGVLVGKSGEMFMLSGLTITSSYAYAGLIGYMEDATVGRFHLSGAIQITDATNNVTVGAVVGQMNGNSIVYDVSNAVSIEVTTTQDANVGGIIGHGTGTISNVVNNAAIAVNGAVNGTVGGIAAAPKGTNGLILKKIENTGAVEISHTTGISYAGGIIGVTDVHLLMADEDTLIRNSGQLSGSSNSNLYSGGILGRATVNAQVSFSTQTSNAGEINVIDSVTGSTYAGGLVGSFEQNLALNISFTQSVALTNAASASAYTGGIAGFVDGDFTWGQSFTNSNVINASGTNGVFTGGLVGKATGTIAFNDAAKNTGSIGVSGSADQVYTGGLVGFAGNRLLLNSNSEHAYANSGTITVAGNSGIYTGGIVSNKAYKKNSNEDVVSSSGYIHVSGNQKLYTGGFVGIVSGSDIDFFNETFGSTISVTAISTDGNSQVYTGGVVGHYAGGGTIAAPVFNGNIAVTGGTGAYTGGVAGYISGGAVTNAAVGNTDTSFSQISSDGHVGGIAGYINGRVSAAAVKYVTIQSGGNDGFAGGIAGQSKGEIVHATVGEAVYAGDNSLSLIIHSSGTSAGGIIGADDGLLNITSSTVNRVVMTSNAAYSNLGGVAGSASANVNKENPDAAIEVKHISIISKGEGSNVGGVIGNNSADLLNGQLLRVSEITIAAEGKASNLGGIAGNNRGAMTKLAVDKIRITAKGTDNKIGGMVGTATTSAITGNGTDVNVKDVQITTTSAAAGSIVGGVAGDSNAATMTSLVVERPILTVGGDRSALGGVVGYVKGAKITLSKIYGMLPDYAVLSAEGADSSIGGIAGQAEQATIEGNASDNNVEYMKLSTSNAASGAHIGGVIGTAVETKIGRIFAQEITLVQQGSNSYVGGIVGKNKGTTTAFLADNYIRALNITVQASASSSTVGGMIGLNDARDGGADLATIETAVSTVQNSRILANIVVHAPGSITGGMIGENKAIVANNSIADNIPIKSDGNQGVVGGLIGKNTGKVYYTYSNAILSIGGEATAAGGLVGDNTGSIIASYMDRNLTGGAAGTSGSYAFLGGITGKNSGSIDKSYASAVVTASGAYTYVGGLAGEHSGSITNSYSAKEIVASKANSFGGGLIGQLTTGTVSGSYSAGQVTVQNGARAGGFAGHYDNRDKMLISNTYYVKDEAKHINSGLLDFGGGAYYELNLYERLSPILSAELADRTYFPGLSGWTFSDTAWKYGSSNAEYKYPELNRNANTGEGGGSNVNSNIAWYTKNPASLRFAITSEAELAGLSGLVNGTVTGVERFNFKGRIVEITAPIHIQSNQWIPIGNQEANAYEGTLDGKNNLISGLKISNNSLAGLFGVMGSSATVKNVYLEPVSVVGDQLVGSLAAWNKGAVSSVYVTLAGGAEVFGRNQDGVMVGGIIGKNTGRLENLNMTLQGGSKVDSIAKNAVVGGLIADNANNISNAALTLTSGYIEASGEQSIVGGLIGRQSGNVGTLTGSIQAEGTVKSTGLGSIAGGMIGHYASGTADGLTFTFADGKLETTASNSITGGMIGKSDINQITKNVTVIANNTTEVVNISGRGIVGGVFGDKTGKGSNVFDLENAAVHSVVIAAFDNGTIGGVAGRLTNAAVKAAAFDGSLKTAADGVQVGGIVGYSKNSIVYKPEVSPKIVITTTSGSSAIGGVAGKVESSAPNAALDFGYFIPFYSGIYEAKVNVGTIQVVGSGNRADVSAGTIAGQLKSASIYNSVSAADLEVSGVQTASVGGVAGTSDGFIINTSVQTDIHADSSSIYNVGGIAGQATGGQIAYTRALSPANEQITVGNAVTRAGITAATHVGGFIGTADATEIQKSSANLPVTVNSSHAYNAIYAGGFAGLLGDSAPGLIEMAYAEGAITVSGKSGAYVGGFAGTVNDYTIQQAYATGDVSNMAFDARGGGFAAVINQGGTIEDAYAAQDSVAVSGDRSATRSYAGGFAGYNDGKLTRVYESVQTVVARANGANSYMGALIGYNFHEGTVVNSYYTGSLAPIHYDINSSAQTVKKADFTNRAKLENWDFSTNASIWGYVDGVNHNEPALVHIANWAFAPDLSFISSHVKGDFAFEVITAEQLAGVVLLNNELSFYRLFDRSAATVPSIGKISLGADIGLAKRLWTPFSAMRSEFDGKNHTISGLTLTAEAYDKYGFVSENYDTFANVKFVGANVTGGTNTGIAVGLNNAGATITNVSVSGAISNVGTVVGGIAAINAGQINASYSKAVIHTSNELAPIAAGGIAGHNTSTGSIEQSFAYSSLSIDSKASNVGGLVGENEGAIANSYHSGTVDAAGKDYARAGGIVGYAAGGSIRAAINTGQVIASINGKLVLGKSYFGGIAGQLADETELQNNYFDSQMLQQNTAYFNEDGSRVKTKMSKVISMKTNNLVNGSLPDGLNATIWTASQGTYPQLKYSAETLDGVLSTVAVVLSQEDSAYRVTSRYTLTQDASISWSTERQGNTIVLTATKNSESRSLNLNKTPVGYAETAVNPTSPTSLELNSDTKVKLDTSEAGGLIYYTLDGKQPTEESLLYAQPIPLSVTTTVKAVTVVLGKNDSGIFEATFKKAAASGGDSGPVVGGGGAGGDSVGGPVVAQPTPTPVPEPKAEAEVLINGKAETAGTETTAVQGGTTTTTVVVNEEVIQRLLKQEGENAVVTIVVKSVSDIAVGELSGQLVKDMETSHSILEVKTETASYNIPASLINMDRIAEQLGKQVELRDIKVQIELRKPADEQVRALENAAAKGGFTIAAPPVDFRVTYTYESFSGEISSFDHYVQRTLEIPEGVDPSKVTTGVVVQPDGTVKHVPTKIIQIDGKSYAVISSLTNSTYSLIMNSLLFNDVKTHWAKETINDMGSRMVIGGVGNGLFEPNRDITRAEFAAIVVKALGLKSGSGSNPFNDVNSTDWYSASVMTAYEHGIITGYEDGSFKPMDNMTREQAMTMIARAMKITGLDAKLPMNETEQWLTHYTDADHISDYAKASIAECLKTGIMTGKGTGTIAPRDNITRAEVAVIVQRLLRQSGLI